ncbi:MAG: ABC transporter substrate-binding protein [Symploca sp. SIO2C1]|nr:ABC transporter substrate-binding protein [Symploca sp. SIO2C1]
MASFEGQMSAKVEATTEHFSRQEYDQAIGLLKTARSFEVNDPEALIYLNNAELENNKQKYYTIAVVAPLNASSSNTQKNSGIEIIRGIAQAQELVNHPEKYQGYRLTQADGKQLGNKINSLGLKVVIADDGNQAAIAKQIAEDLSKNTEIQGVIGHFSSDVTKAVAPLYEENQLVLISPTSTAVKIFPSRKYTFRTVPTNDEFAIKLADYLSRQGHKKVAVIYNNESEYSSDLKSGFRSEFPGQTTEDLQFSDNSLPDNLEKILEAKATAIVLLPDGKTRPKALDVVRNQTNSDIKIVGGDSFYNDQLSEIQNLKEGLVLAVPWYRGCHLDSEFLKVSKKLWGTGAVSWRTAFAYDATLVLIEALKQKPATRQELQQILVSDNPQFQVKYGATGEIRFKDGGDRLGGRTQLVEVVNNQGSLKFQPKPSCN